ncbi:MAG: hypothetical protein EA428_08095 [Spirochaetaceae bacterium]|nr:MAG: hypothetical protein EA428_08095 [Spirochaetaceae bacterium]
MESKPVVPLPCFFIGLAILLSLFIISCGTTATIPEPTTELADGYHYAELEPDEDGWIATLEIHVESGEILSVSFDEVQREGSDLVRRKSEDSEYAEQWAAASGGLNQFGVYPVIEQEFQRTGSPSISAISGATATIEKMKNLGDRVLDGLGAQVPLHDGLHRVELQPDNHDYPSALEVQVAAGRLLQVSYNGASDHAIANPADTSYSRIEARLKATANPNALAGISAPTRSVEDARALSAALFEH